MEAMSEKVKSTIIEGERRINLFLGGARSPLKGTCQTLAARGMYRVYAQWFDARKGLSLTSEAYRERKDRARREKSQQKVSRGKGGLTQKRSKTKRRGKRGGNRKEEGSSPGTR